jgi:hypothetical protein
VQIEHILRGGLMTDHPLNQMIREAMPSARRQLVLTDFGPEELLEFYSAERLAYEIWSCGATLRSLGKGCSLHAMQGEPYFAVTCSEELNGLLSHYDGRLGEYEASATGTVFWREISEGTVVMPMYNVEQTNSERYEKVFAKYESALPEPVVTNFIWILFPLRDFHDAHQPFAGAFFEAHGVSFDDVISVIAALMVRVIVTWGERRYSIFHYFQRAYEGPALREEVVSTIRHTLPLAMKSLGRSRDAKEVAVESVVDFLGLSGEKRGKIDPLLGGPLSIFLPFRDDRLFVDYAWIPQILYMLFFGINIADQNFKGDALENLVHRNRSALPTAACRSRDGTSRQFDAAFAVSDLLIVVECRAKARSLGVERGDFESLRVRREFLEKALRDIDEKAEWLRRRPVGTNYDVHNFRRILPLVVTPFVEFIPRRDPWYWLSANVPRVLTPAELRQFLEGEELTDRTHFNELNI